MALPGHHYQPQQPQSQSKSFRVDFDAQMSQPLSYLHRSPFHVVGLAPPDDLQWNLGSEHDRKRFKEQENNSQLSCVDIMQPRSVSTGLGLSLDNTRFASTGDSAFLSLIGDDINCQLLRHDAEIDTFLRLQSERLRETVLENVQATQLRSISVIEDKVLQKLHEREAEVESINRRNIELEERMEQLTVEADVWQQRATYNENMIAALKFNLQQVHVQSRDSKEGCGDSEVDDAVSCFDGCSIDFHPLSGEKCNEKEIMTCKACRVNVVSMLLLPCKHLCLCKDCESKLSFCPLCQSSKFIGMEVYM
ncbi:probable BOI-related E3 ubiquitin-protein ligase 3 [Abrus precatorius]|uniref:Probable BOI-related E3 ubiquitin-protein ligase 3 n=1 Tax=Abrus precatorius TaxID=3816 RepID=A0A8B8LJW5_ABRPR|nr:probable BOI-related E3 ubiquitin-protein ligase 3 [Abrus precatorius]XP_027355655.1 probable BOI-related E3 ubiquitin-protein ligase 3 [Abrus precatorius]